MDVTLITHMFNNINFIRIKTQNVPTTQCKKLNQQLQITKKKKKTDCLSDFAKATQI